MKKNIIAIMAVVACMLVAIGGVIYTKNYYENKLVDVSVGYETRIGDLSVENNKLSRENNELRTSMTDIEDQVYNLMNNKAYKINILHDGARYVYAQENDDVFAVSHTTVIK